MTDLLNAHSEHIKAKYSPKRDLSWKFVFAKTGLKGKKSIQSEEAIRMFTEALDITAPVDLVQPQLELGLISEYVNDTELKHVYFGEFVCLLISFFNFLIALDIRRSTSVNHEIFFEKEILHKYHIHGC